MWKIPQICLDLAFFNFWIYAFLCIYQRNITNVVIKGLFWASKVFCVIVSGCLAGYGYLQIAYGLAILFNLVIIFLPDRKLVEYIFNFFCLFYKDARQIFDTDTVYDLVSNKMQPETNNVRGGTLISFIGDFLALYFLGYFD